MGSHRVHGGWHPPCCRERSRHKSEQRPRHLYRTRDKSCSLPLHVLSLSREPNLGLCSLLEITDLRIERTLEVSGPLLTGGLKEAERQGKPTRDPQQSGV